jgi:hypothetical protein
MEKRSTRSIHAVMAILLAASLTTACKQLDNLQDMHDSTQGMAETTGRMAQTTDQMAQVTGQMAQTTGQLLNTTAATYQDLRQGNSLTIRTERLDRMEESKSIEAKISEAGKFFMAMEFQLWKPKLNTEDEMLSHDEDAIVEFFRSIKNYMKPGEENLSPASSDDNMLNLYSLAAAMHRVNPEAEKLGREYGYTPKSFLDLLEEGLRAGVAIRDGRQDMHDIPNYILETLREEQAAIYILRLRYNFLAAMPLADVSKIEEDGGFLGIPGLFRKAHMVLGGWNADVSKLNPSELEYASIKMEGAIQTRDFLKGIGVDPKTDKNLLKIYRHMRIKPHSASYAGGQGDALLARFQSAVDRFLGARTEQGADLKLMRP